MTIDYIGKRILNAIKKSWDKDTANGEWFQDIPSFNQCAVTALVIQDFYGGQLLRCETSGGHSHYWNRIPSGREIDLTHDQFNYVIDDKPLYKTTIVRKRDYVVSFPDTANRYQILKERVVQILREESKKYAWNPESKL